MVDVLLHFEIQDHMGTTRHSLWKDIKMPAPPIQGLVIDDNDIDFEIERRVIYSIKNQTYYCRIIKYEKVGDEDSWLPLLLREGWKERNDT